MWDTGGGVSGEGSSDGLRGRLLGVWNFHQASGETLWPLTPLAQEAILLMETCTRMFIVTPN